VELLAIDVAKNYLGILSNKSLQLIQPPITIFKDHIVYSVFVMWLIAEHLLLERLFESSKRIGLTKRSIKRQKKGLRVWLLLLSREGIEG